ncbi:MAG: sigma-70 family RNA polymerase sigma factor [Planctomycetota bacterium]
MERDEAEPADTAAMQQMASLWVRNQNRVAGFIAAAVGDFHAVEDILQDVAVDVAKKFHTFDQTREFSPWALGIAKNCVAAYFRRLGASKIVYRDPFLDTLYEITLRQSSDEAEDRLRALQHCIEKLQGEARTVIEHRYRKAQSVQQIAELLQTSASAVSVRLHRARKALAGCVERTLAAESHG